MTEKKKTFGEKKCECVRVHACMTASRRLHISKVYQFFPSSRRTLRVVLKLQDHGQSLSRTQLELTFLEGCVEMYVNLWGPQNNIC